MSLIIRSIIVTLLSVFYFYFIKDYIHLALDFVRSWYSVLLYTIGIIPVLLILFIPCIVPFLMVIIFTGGKEDDMLFMNTTLPSHFGFCTLYVFTVMPKEIELIGLLGVATVIFRMLKKNPAGG